MAKDAKAAVAILYHPKTDTIARVNHKAKGYEGRKMYKAWAANIYYEPGGKVIPGETAQEAVIREILEETGLDLTLGQNVRRFLKIGPHFLQAKPR